MRPNAGVMRPSARNERAYPRESLPSLPSPRSSGSRTAVRSSGSALLLLVSGALEHRRTGRTGGSRSPEAYADSPLLPGRRAKIRETRAPGPSGVEFGPRRGAPSRGSGLGQRRRGGARGSRRGERRQSGMDQGRKGKRFHDFEKNPFGDRAAAE
ncbi:hypothetical protein KM043_010513 [Ampulex compressa]|nr:hypothetical protein KM043_010513 [Ampulex compressa]